jgi:hypothetical protein
MFMELVLSNLSKFKLIIILLSLFVSLLGLSLTVYSLIQGYLHTGNPFYSEHFIGAAMGMFLAGGSGFVSLCFLYFLGRELSNQYHRIFLVGSLISIFPCAMYFIVVIVSVVLT